MFKNSKMTGIIALILAFVFTAAVFAACSKPLNNGPVNLQAVYNKLIESGKLPELTAVPERDLFEVYGIDSSKLYQWVFAMSENYSINAGEVAMFEVNDESYVPELQQKLQNHLDRLKAVSKDYSPDQSAKLEPVQVTTVGKIVYLVVGEDYSSLMKIIKDNIG